MTFLLTKNSKFDTRNLKTMGLSVKSSNQPMDKIKTETLYRDSPQRSLIKTITYRLFASGAMFLGIFIFSHQYQRASLTDSLSNAGVITVLEFFVKLVIYYFHERIWSGINWGKYWKRHYWIRRAWRRAYRNAHK
ncbi:MAG: hypothetical protein CVT94_11550 [Bacteroidetes bacterium HGW-Bacteroidetes-11]|jgi:uncharacterized membrane protein|nr:MAG: hypothetical protein CVT94_11550 [Bacteroidetes bacterium HGW-Bacteroidetes-11]